jgi:hypothetical protein
LRSPENYTGYDRTENFASPGGPVRARSRRGIRRQIKTRTGSARHVQDSVGIFRGPGEHTDRLRRG